MRSPGLTVTMSPRRELGDGDRSRAAASRLRPARGEGARGREAHECPPLRARLEEAAEQHERHHDRARLRNRGGRFDRREEIKAEPPRGRCPERDEEIHIAGARPAPPSSRSR